MQKATEEGNIRIRKAKELNKRIEALEEKAAKNGKLSKSETKELQRLYEQRNNLAVKSLSKGEKNNNVLCRVCRLTVEQCRLKKLLRQSKNQLKLESKLLKMRKEI